MAKGHTALKCSQTLLVAKRLETDAMILILLIVRHERKMDCDAKWQILVWPIPLVSSGFLARAKAHMRTVDDYQVRLCAKAVVNYSPPDQAKSTWARRAAGRPE